MTYPADTDRVTHEADRADLTYRDRAYAMRSRGSTMWIVVGLLVLLAALAIWGGLFDGTELTVTDTAAPPAAEAPATAPAPAPQQ